MTAQYILHKSKNDQFYFVLTADNNQTILKSEMYTAKASAQNGAESVRTNCTDDANFERLTSANGQFYFNLRAANHQVIGTSEMYTTKAACENGIQAVMKVGPAAPLSDQTA